MPQSRIILGLVVLANLLAVSGTAQAARRFAREGVVELGGVASFSVSEGDLNLSDDITRTQLQLAPELGFFVLNGLELGIKPTFELIDYDFPGDFFEPEALKIFGMLFNPSYNFDTGGAVFPFFGADVGLQVAWANNTETAFVVGGEAGIKVQLGQAGLLRIQGQYLARFYDDTLTTFLVGVGFSTFF